MNTQRWQTNWDNISIFNAILPITVGVALMTATTASVSAQSVIVIKQGSSPGVSQSPTGSPFIYGSPIPTPIPVNPMNGLLPSPTNYYYPARGNVYSYPMRGNVENSTLLNPVLVNPRIRDSKLINPVIVNEQGRRRRAIRRSRVIIYP